MINDNQQQIVLTLASDLSLKSMKGTLKGIFGKKKSYMNISNGSNISSDPIIKEEDAFSTAQKKYK